MLFVPNRIVTDVNQATAYRTLITGAGSGIGRAFARALANQGQALILLDRDAAALHETIESLPPAIRHSTHLLAIDLASPTATTAVYRHCRRHDLRVGTLINNAGIGGQSPFQRHPRRHMRQLVEVNINAVVELTRAFLPAMLRAGEGAIVNISSLCAFESMPESAVYGATKAFVLHFTESLQDELRGTGVYVTAVCPGVTRTPFLVAEGYSPADIPPFAQSAEEVVEESLQGMRRRKPLIVTGRRNRIRIAAQRLSLRSVARSAMSVVRMIVPRRVKESAPRA